MISVIVPIHNTEKYLNQCLQSIVNQTYKDIEILCIDSSTDNSCNILEEWKKQDKRIKVIYDANGSYGHKINVGIIEACGEYISIVDSDDMMSKSMLNLLYNTIKDSDLDFVKSDYSRFHEENGKIQIDEYSKCLLDDSFYNRIIEPQQFPEILWKSNICIWTGIYKSSFLKENNIYIHESAGASFQDCGFAVLTTVLAHKVFYLSESLYRYRIDNAGSSVKDESKIMTIVDEWQWIENNLAIRKILNDNLLFCLKGKKIVTFYWNYMRLQREKARWFASQTHELLYKEYICDGKCYTFEFEIREMLFDMYYANDKSVNDRKVLAEEKGIDIYYTKPDDAECSIIIWEDDKYLGGNWEKALLSILRQSVKEVEVWAICSDVKNVEMYQWIDARINVLEMKDSNLEVWDYINIALRKMSGTYVFMMTNTERLYDCSLENVIKLAKTNDSELLFFDAEIFNDEVYTPEQLPYLSYYKHEESYGHVDNIKCMQINMQKSPWCDSVIPILAKRTLIDNNSILFKKGVISPKRLFEAKMIMYADVIFQVNDRFMCKEVQSI